MPTIYPNLLDKKGQPIPPYDVTAHNLPQLLGAEVIPVRTPFRFPRYNHSGQGTLIGAAEGGIRSYNKKFVYGTYKSSIPSMDEGWTRWVIEDKQGKYKPPFSLYYSGTAFVYRQW